jgi:N-acetylglucosaminyldiphosphoundecaprenol N-acetyl-beta-D-mannosaminyltransferase
MMTSWPTVDILGIPIHKLTMQDVLTAVGGMMLEPRLHQIATVNPEFIMRAQTDDAFQIVLNRADLCLADGIGVVWAARHLGQPVPERVPGSELVYHLAERAAQEGWRLFLLGAAPGVAEKAAEILKERYTGLNIVGTFAGSPAASENENIVQMINESKADLLWVAYGAPQQDLWIDRNRAALSTVRVAVGVGGSLDFITGQAVRAPVWIQKLGLEWLHRLSKEPWRWRRMLALPRFVVRVLWPSG